MATSFTKLKTAGLRTLLTLIGAPTTGTKPVLLAHLQQKLETPTIASHQGGRTRILSIDMGIKNLAYCVADVEIPGPATARLERGRKARKGENQGVGSSEPQDAPAMKVTTWRRISLHCLPFSTSSPASRSSSPSQSSTGEEKEDPFHPRTLATTAHTLLTATLLPHAPHTLLIERQRYRSRGGAAVQDWTYRVNLLEGMLWAVLRTLRGERMGRKGKGGQKIEGVDTEGGPEVWDVSPARVVGFWVGEGKEGGKRGKARAKGAEGKKAKVALVGRWLGGERVTPAGGAGAGSMGIQLSFAGEAEGVRKAFLEKLMKTRGSRKGSESKPTSKKKGKRQDAAQILIESVSVADGKPVAAEEVEDIGKLDDLADCLLQAAAWVQWEANRRRVAVMDEQELLRLVDECAG